MVTTGLEARSPSRDTGADDSRSETTYFSWTVSTEPVVGTTAFRPGARGPTSERPALEKSQGHTTSLAVSTDG